MDFNSQSAQQFAIEPFQRIEIPIGAASPQYKGITIPIAEGCGFFVERCDYPVLCSVVGKNNQVEATLVLKEGDDIRAPMKGITITYPSIANTSGYTPKLVLQMYKNGTYQNNLSTVQTRLGVASRTFLNTALTQSHVIHIPAGLRVIRRIEVFITWTTLTSSPLLQFARNDGTGPSTVPVITTDPNITIPPGQTYNEANPYGAVLQYNPGAIANSGVFFGEDIIIPPDAYEASLAWIGTGLAPQQTLRWQVA